MRFIKIFNIILFVMLFITGCANKTVEDAFRDRYSGKDFEIIHTEQVNNDVFVFFKAPAQPYNFAMGIAVINQDKNGNWKIQDSFYISENVDNISTHSQGMFVSQDETQEIAFGIIENPNIADVEMIKANGDIKKRKIKETKGFRFWYIFVNPDELINCQYRALSAEGKELN